MLLRAAVYKAMFLAPDGHEFEIDAFAPTPVCQARWHWLKAIRAMMNILAG